MSIMFSDNPPSRIPSFLHTIVPAVGSTTSRYIFASLCLGQVILGLVLMPDSVGEVSVFAIIQIFMWAISPMLLNEWPVPRWPLDLFIAVAGVSLTSLFLYEKSSILLLLPSAWNLVLLSYMGRGILTASIIGGVVTTMVGSYIMIERGVPLIGSSYPIDRLLWALSMQLWTTLQLLIIFSYKKPQDLTRPSTLFRSFILPQNPLFQRVLSIGSTWLTAPVFPDESETQIAHRAYPIILLLIGTPLLALFIHWSLYRLILADVVFNLFIVCLGGLLLFLLRSGRVRLVTGILLAQLFTGTAFGCWVYGWLHPTALGFLLGDILIALHLAPRLALGAMLGISLLLLFATGSWAQHYGLLPQPNLNPAQSLGGSVIAMFNTLVILHAYHRRFQTTVQQSHTSAVNYQQVLADAPIGIVVLDHHLRVMYVNQAILRCFEISPQLVDRSWRRFEQRLLTLEGVSKAVTKCLNTGSPFTLDILTRRAVASDPLRLQVYGVGLEDGRGRNVGCQLMVVDLSELVQAEEQLQINMDNQEKIRRDLHDGILQALFAHGLQLEDLIQTVHDLEQRDFGARIQGGLLRLDQVIETLKSMIGEGDSSFEARHTFMRNLQSFCEIIEKVGDVKIDVHCPETLLATLTSQELEHVSMIAQEALSNVIQHAHASRVWVKLMVMDQGVVFEVRDDGSGFPDDTLRLLSRDKHRGHGLPNMEARAKAINARVDLDSTPEMGTSLRICFSASDQLRKVASH
ncbi:MAG: ATP-binding protein [Nitrospirales bacterium]|nr:PAS domain-containing protein [Nitrospira sp.]MDR4501395.1 ATP-binding protein [Nitrospirales bacterium]